MQKNLADKIEGYHTNTNLIKFFAALMVIVSHSFVLSENAVQKELFFRLTNGQITMGTFAVGIFFFFSGLYISRSLDKNTSAKQFVKRRLFRIFPPLILVVFLCAFLLGPMVSTLAIQDYFGNIDTWKYLLNCFTIRVHNLPGVFENNCYLPTVNGSLWTIPLELVCYIFCFLICRSGCCRKAYLPFAVLILGVFSAGIWYVPSLDIGTMEAALFPCLMFLQGMFCYAWRDRIRISVWYFLVCLFCLAVSDLSGIVLIGLSLTLPYMLLYLGFFSHRVPELLAKPGEWSYGIYLCAFPIQQMFVFLHGGSMPIYKNVIYSVPAAILVGFFIHFVTSGRPKDKGKKKSGKTS